MASVRLFKSGYLIGACLDPQSPIFKYTNLPDKGP
jgi:hypothetical protein